MVFFRLLSKIPLNDKDRNFSDETKGVLSKLDDYSLLFSLFGPPALMKGNENPKTSDLVKTSEVDQGWKKDGNGKWIKAKTRAFTKKISERFEIVMLGEGDLQNDKFSCIERLVLGALKSDFFFSLKDMDYVCKDREEASKIMEELLLVEGKALPISYNSDFDMETDDSFSRIFFYGIGCVLLAKQEQVSDSPYGPFVVDMPLQDLAVRSKLFRKYGARVHFSKDQKVTAIFDYEQGSLFQPGQDGWENAKLLAKVTCVFLTTAREHLVWTHWLASNNSTREMTLNLNPEHPIRRLLKVFTFNANVVNSFAFEILMPERSTLHRTSGLTIEALHSVYDSAYASSTIFQPFPERTYNSALQGLIDEGKFPFATQFSEYYEIVRKFVRAWFEKAGDAASDMEVKNFYNAMKLTTKGQAYELPEFSLDALVDLCSTIIFTVTAYHELIGNVVDYATSPWKGGFRVTKKDPSQIDLQSLILTGIIAAATSVRAPALMAPFSNFFGAGGAPSWERDLWDGFIKELEQQSEKVQAQDKAAAFEWKYGDPTRFECSVSV